MAGSRAFWWKRGVAAFALLFLALAIYVGATLPPRAVALTMSLPPTIRFGGYHIHTNRSDGAWSVDDAAAAAARAGLHFIILTDHGDATRAPDPPAYRHGVLVIDAVEISTADGHVVALSLDTPSPYPLAGRGKDVIEDIHRLGGWAVIAHPDSQKPELRWNAWDTAYDGIEWLNADSEWRDESKTRLALTALRAMVRGPESIAALFSRPTTTISRWTSDLQHRPVVALGAMDAHGSFPLGNAVLKTVWQGVELEAPLTGQAGDDARTVLAALRRGRTFTIIPAIAGPAALSFTATQSDVIARPGDRLDSRGEPVTFRVSVAGVPAAHVELLLNDHPVVPLEGTREAGAYRVEGTLRNSGVPWVFSNPIYVGKPTPAPEGREEPASLERIPVPSGGRWTSEHAAGSSGEVVSDGDEGRFTFSLGTDVAQHPYAALVAAVTGSARLHLVEFAARADMPTRVSVQLRVPHAGFPDGLRWRRSVYVDQTPRQYALDLRDFDLAVSGAARIEDNARDIRSLLFVIDTVNSKPGARGAVWISNVAMDLR